MFFVTYLRRELRRRMRQAIFIALGLALGVGLVVTVTAASAGVKKAQADVLSSLYGVGTDVTVTGAAPGPPKSGTPPKGAQTFQAGPGGAQICGNGECHNAAGQTIDNLGSQYQAIDASKGAAQPQGGSPPDVYIPLARAQAIGTSEGGSLKNKVNTIYVAAASAADIPAVQSEIKKLLPGDTVTTASSLASEVTGSLSSTAKLANDLGKWLSVLVLIAAFAVASLLTIAAVSRRVRGVRPPQAPRRPGPRRGAPGTAPA